MISAIIFDYARTLVDIDQNPPRLMEGAEDILMEFKRKKFKLALVSRGQDLKLRKKEFIDLRLDKFFDILEVVGVGGTKDFLPIIKKLKVTPQKCLVVGDRVESEIEQGNLVGAHTVWIKWGKFANQLPKTAKQQPKFIIQNITELASVLEQLNG